MAASAPILVTKPYIPPTSAESGTPVRTRLIERLSEGLAARLRLQAASQG